MTEPLRYQILADRLVKAKAEFRKALSLIEAERLNGELTSAQASEAVRQLRASYDAECQAARDQARAAARET